MAGVDLLYLKVMEQKSVMAGNAPLAPRTMALRLETAGANETTFVVRSTDCDLLFLLDDAVADGYI